MFGKKTTIPQDHLETIFSLKHWLYSLKMGLPQGDDRTRYLFEIYNEYMRTTNKYEVETCSSCRGKVMLKIKNLIEDAKI